ncbi:MAG: HAD hydrolase-like protein [Patescibacteria group bacterium]|mgnify:CR=1 FL=1
MKYIFDFDDVLFNNTAQFKEHMFKILAEAGVSEEKARAYYKEVRTKKFSLKKFIKELFSRYPEIKKTVAETYEAIMQECPKFLNTTLVEGVKRLKKDNCYIVSNGDEEFQGDKIKYSGMGNLFHDHHIFLVPGEKRTTIAKVCEQEENKGIEFVFIDDKQEFIDEINPQDFPNVTTILYDREGKKGLARLMAETNASPTSELKRRK